MYMIQTAEITSALVQLCWKLERWYIFWLIRPKRFLHYSWNNMFCCYTKVTLSLRNVYQSRLLLWSSLPATCTQWLCKSLSIGQFLFFFFLAFVKGLVRAALCSSCSSLLLWFFQSPQRWLLHAGGQETEAQGWRFGKKLCGSTLHCKPIKE